jgi:hypothetical protein
VDSLDGVDFLVHFALGQQHVDFFDAGRFDGAKSIGFKYPADMVEPFLLDDSLFREPFGEAADGFGFVYFAFV